MVSSVLNTRLRPAKQSSAMARNWAPLKSIAPRSIARNTRSGMLVGPGLIKKWYPRLTAMRALRLSLDVYRSASDPRPLEVDEHDRVRRDVLRLHPKSKKAGVSLPSLRSLETP